MLPAGRRRGSVRPVDLARYDAIADSYADEFSSTDDPVTAALLTLIGPVAGLRILDVACGHGRLTNELARRGGRVTGLDISGALIAKARAGADRNGLGTTYLLADIATWRPQPDQLAAYDVVTCLFGLSDIDDLDGCAASVATALKSGGLFAFSILHPCFAGGAAVSGSWRTGGTYYDEGRWIADGELSTLRRQVGANHRMLSTYVNTLSRHGLVLAELVEPAPPSSWSARRLDASRYPVFLVARCVRA